MKVKIPEKYKDDNLAGNNIHLSKELVAWLDDIIGDENYDLIAITINDLKMSFGQPIGIKIPCLSYKKYQSSETYYVEFKDKDAAMLFKLTWY